MQLVRASYVAMDFTYRTVVIPLGLASLTTGLVSSLGTDWGLLRHYWVVLKVMLTAPAVWLMLVHAGLVRYAAHMTSVMPRTGGNMDGLKGQLILYAGAALMVLLTATILSIYKPRGRTRYGVRKLASRSM